jgi:hypothetical protein
MLIYLNRAQKYNIFSNWRRQSPFIYTLNIRKSTKLNQLSTTQVLPQLITSNSCAAEYLAAQESDIFERRYLDALPKGPIT